MLLISSSVFFSGLNGLSKDLRFSPQPNLLIQQHPVVAFVASDEEAPQIVDVAVGGHSRHPLRVKF